MFGQGDVDIYVQLSVSNSSGAYVFPPLYISLVAQHMQVS